MIKREDNQLGKFIEEKRKQMGLTVREIGTELGFSVTYISDIEKGNRKGFSYENLKKLASILKMSEEEERTLYTLAGISRDTIPLDIIPFIRNNPSIIDLLRQLKYGKEKGIITEALIVKLTETIKESNKKAERTDTTQKDDELEL